MDNLDFLFTILFLTIYLISRKINQNESISLLILLDFIIFPLLADWFESSGWFGTHGFYAWYTLYTINAIVIAKVVSMLNYQKLLANKILSLVYLMYSIYCLLIIIQYTPINGGYPDLGFDFLSNYSLVTLITSMLIVVCVALGLFNTRRKKRNDRTTFVSNN